MTKTETRECASGELHGEACKCSKKFQVNTDHPHKRFCCAPCHHNSVIRRTTVSCINQSHGEACKCDREFVGSSRQKFCCKACADNAFKKKTETSSAMDRDSLQKYAKSLETRIRLWDVIGDRIVDAARNLSSLRIPEPPTIKISSLSEETWVLHISDVQAGSKVSSVTSGALGDFNTQILDAEIKYLEKSIASIISYHANRPRRLVIFFLGDMIDGSTIFLGQQRAIDMTTVQQVMFVVDRFSMFVNAISSLFESVDCYGIVGNHGRLGKKGENDPLDNLDWLAYKWMQERLIANKRVTFTPSESWFQLIEILGWRFLIVHGDDIPQGTWGIPFYGALRGEQRWTKLLDEVQFDYLSFGHHHTKASFGNIFMNGSWPGGSEFSLKKLLLGGMPTQKLLGVNKKYGVTWQRDIQLVGSSESKIKIYG